MKNQNIELSKQVRENPGNEQKTKMFAAEKRRFEEALRIKQNHLNSQVTLNTEKDRQINKLKSDLENITDMYAHMSA